MIEDRKIIEMNIADTIMERPYGFQVNKRHFYLYPITLGKTYLLSRLIESLDMNADIIKSNPYMEALRLCQEKKILFASYYHIIRSTRKKNYLIAEL